MSEEQEKEYTVREVVAVFHRANELEAAIDQLASSGIARQDISVMGSHDTIAQKLGHHFKQVKTIEDNAAVPSAHFARKEEVAEAEAAAIGLPLYIGGAGGALAVAASGGALALAAAAAAAGGLAGAGIGAIFAKALGEHHAKTIQSKLEAGGLLLWVRINNEEQERSVSDLLSKAGGKDVHAHDIKRTWGEKDIPLHDWQPDPLLLTPEEYKPRDS